MKYVSNPSTFVATILIGNNLANYITTFAIGYLAILSWGNLSEFSEVSVTICISPLIFVFGELLPKTLHYRAPLLMLKRYFNVFRCVHWLLFPLSWPLMMLTTLFQKLGGIQQQPMLRILGRGPLANVIGRGHDEGVLTGVQHDLIQRVFQNANLKLDPIITPKEVAFSFEQTPSRTELLDHAQAFGLVEIAIAQAEESAEPPCYYRVAELLLSNAPLAQLKHSIPQIPVKYSRLEALLVLQEHNADIGCIYDDQKLIGIIRRRVLAETILQGNVYTTEPTGITLA
ncbi:MAG: DUF21 domain-containing protein [Planctomycetaceae bacterium]|nr:DUF21 domain-containing protein [Planctomycetaceae bacterium]